MNRVLVLGLLVVLVASVALTGPAVAKKKWEKIEIPELNEVKMPAFERVELDNGMIVYLAEDHKFPLVELSATIDAGSIYEPADKVGLASMTGEVMRSGGTVTTDGDALDEMIEARGMRVETWIGNTDGGAYLSVMKEDTALGMELLADILMNPAFPEDKIKLAKESQKAGISRRNDDPMTIARREAMKAVFGADHELARHTEYATIASVTRDDMLAFHADWFHPDRMYLVVIGDFDSKEMVNLIESSFAGWEKATKVLPADPEIPEFPRTVNVVNKEDLTQTTVIMGHNGIRADSPHYAGVLVGNRILGGGFATRLFNEVRSRQGLAYSVGSRSGTGFRFPGLFMAFTMTKSESSQKATQAILTEIQRMRTEEVTDEELERAKDGILNSEVFSYDTKREILNRMVMFERYGYAPDFLKKYQESVKSMTKAKVLEAAKAVWHPDRMTILAVGAYNDWDSDFSSFGPVTMVDIEIPEPALEIPDATPESLAHGKELMTLCAEDCGGVKKFKALKSLFMVNSMDATIQGMDLTFTTEKSIRYPGYSHYLLKTPFGNQTTVLAGEKGWASGTQGVQDLEGEQLQAAKDELKTDTIGIYRNLDKLKCQALVPTKVDGVPCNPVHISGIGDDYRIVFLRADNNRVFMVQQPGMSPMSGAPVTQKMYIDEYMEIEWLTTAKKLRLLYDDELFGSITVTEVKINPQLDGSLFVK
ncbi:MAG: insulinase family protein [Gemmatimonadales bacterium]|nr:insulinase family protein [Gemmatimonadales bacterium]